MATKTTIDRDTADLQQRTARIEEKLDHAITLVEDFHEKIDSHDKWREGVDTERRIIRAATSIIAAALVSVFINSCSLHPNVSPISEAPTPTAKPVETYAPTHTSTPTPTETPTPDMSATPTQITPSPSIIEVTPLGGGYSAPRPKIEELSGIYTPNARQNVRLGPGASYAVKYRIAGGQKVKVYAWVSDLPLEAWLCLDEECTEAVALVFDGRELGVLEYGE